MSTHDPYAKGDRGIKKICTNSDMQQNTSKVLLATCHELVEGSLTLYSVLLDKKNWTSQKILNMVTSGKAKNHYIQRTTTKTILSKHQQRLGSSSGMTKTTQTLAAHWLQVQWGERHAVVHLTTLCMNRRHWRTSTETSHAITAIGHCHTGV